MDIMSIDHQYHNQAFGGSMTIHSNGRNHTVAEEKYPVRFDMLQTIVDRIGPAAFKKGMKVGPYIRDVLIPKGMEAEGI